MKVRDHVEYLLRQGRKPKELVELGFPKSVVTRVRKQLREEKTSQPRKGRAEAGSQPSPTLPVEMAPIEEKLTSLESEIKELESRVEILETIGMDLVDMEARLDDTPALGLKGKFACDCGASGFVAIRIKCTKCGRETWWGWYPEG